MRDERGCRPRGPDDGPRVRSVTRRWTRRLLGLPVLTLTVMIAAPAVERSSRDRVPDTVTETVDVQLERDRRGQATAGRPAWQRSAPVPAGDTVLVGIDWGTAAPVPVEIRTRTVATWSDWRPVGSPPNGPDVAQGLPQRVASAPVWVGGADAFQLRAPSRGPDAVRLVRIASRGGDGLGYVPRALRAPPGSAVAATTRPGVVPRASWDPNGDCRPRTPPRYEERARFAVVHHTAASNDYEFAEVDDLLRAICVYHVQTNGWDDLGYNFLIDRFGTAYEGRAGGTDRAVVGAHTTGFNQGSVGVAVLGNFVDADPPSAAVKALDRLLAWRLDQDHIDPDGTVETVAGRSTRWPAGTVVEIPTVVAHRDLNVTADPGRLYRWIGGENPAGPRIRPLGAPKAFGAPRSAREQSVLAAGPRWDVTFDQRLDWRLTVTAEDGTPVRTAEGRDADQVELVWDLRDRTGAAVMPGSYTARLQAWVPGAGVGSTDAVTPVESALEIVPAVERTGGDDRIATAVALSRRTFTRPAGAPDGTPASGQVVLAGAGAFPDALVAAPLAGSLDAPVLLSGRGHLPVAVEDEIERLGASAAILVGGPARLSDHLIEDLRELGVEDVERIAGPTRYDTAGRVAWRVVEREHPDEALLALGTHADPSRAFPDALTAGGFGAGEGLPVLLVTPDALPDASRWVLEQQHWPGGITAVGGPSAVAEPIVEAARVAAGGPPSRRLAGPDRYATSVAAASELLDRWAAAAAPRHTGEQPGREVVVATGRNWPDALGAAAAAARRRGVLVLVDGDGGQADDASGQWLQANAGRLDHGLVVGGPTAIGSGVLRALEEALRERGPHLEPSTVWPDPPSGGD